MVIKWWQLIIAGLIIFGVGNGTGYLFHRAPIVIASPTVTILGKPDTVRIDVPTAHGSRDYWPVPSSHSIDSVGFPSFFSFTKTTDSTQNGIHFTFRSTTYPFVDSTGHLRDSAQIIHEWNIQPLPVQTIHTVDTVKVAVMTPVTVPEPFYKAPGFMFTTGAIVGIGVTILILRSIK